MKKLIALTLCLFVGISSNAQISGDDTSGDTFRTQTIGGWGQKAIGNNAGAYLLENFDMAFPNGVTIGTDGASLTFTSAEAITKFLPSTGTSKALAESLIDPRKQEVRNTLASQALALSITLGLDAYDSEFAANTAAFADMKIAYGDFEGMTIRMLLDEANLALAGMESKYTFAQLNEALSLVNESYVDGEMTNDFIAISSTKATKSSFEFTR